MQTIVASAPKSDSRRSMQMNTEILDSLDKSLAVARDAIYRAPQSMAKKWDLLFEEEQKALLYSLALSRDMLRVLRCSLSPDMAKEIASVLLLIKAQNDILAGNLLIRSGYNKRAIYFIRLALESIAQCIIIFLDSKYYASFKADRTQADRAIYKVQSMLPLDDLDEKAANYLKSLCSKKNIMNQHSHSTVYATLGDYVKMEPAFGPSFDNENIDELRAIQKEYISMAKLIVMLADWMKARLK